LETRHLIAESLRDTPQLWRRPFVSNLDWTTGSERSLPEQVQFGTAKRFGNPPGDPPLKLRLLQLPSATRQPPRRELELELPQRGSRLCVPASRQVCLYRVQSLRKIICRFTETSIGSNSQNYFGLSANVLSTTNIFSRKMAECAEKCSTIQAFIEPSTGSWAS